MNWKRKIAIWAVVIATLAGALAAVLVAIRKAQPITIKGAVLSDDPDPQKQLPIADVQITGMNGSGAVSSSKSDSSGFFSLTLRRGLRRRQPLTLRFRHADYQPLDLNEFVSDKIYIVRMVPIHQPYPCRKWPSRCRDRERQSAIFDKGHYRGGRR